MELFAKERLDTALNRVSRIFCAGKKVPIYIQMFTLDQTCLVVVWHDVVMNRHTTLSAQGEEQAVLQVC